MDSYPFAHSHNNDFLVSFADTFQILKPIFQLLGFQMIPEKALGFYERTGQMLIDERRKEKTVTH